MNDSIVVIQSLQDSLKISQHTSTQLPIELLGLIGVALGALISIVGSWLLAKRQMHLEIQKALFQRKLDTYLRFTELLWPGGIKQHNRHSTNETSISKPYVSNKDLSKWLNDLTLFVAANQLIIDRKSLDAYKELTDKVIEDLKFIANNSTPETIDSKTYEVGIKSTNVIAGLCMKVHNSGWDYFKHHYNVEL